MASGEDVVNLARPHVGEKYVFGASVPKDNAKWKGPWDCAEFASWCVYQASVRLYGCQNDDAPPGAAEAFTGYWARDVEKLGIAVPVQQAARTPGALVLRNPGSKCGHIVISDGTGGTVEAHSTGRGVVTDQLDGRRWDAGVLIPWITYAELGPTPPVVPPIRIYFLRDPPYLKDDTVLAIQKALRRRGIDPGDLDGEYGPHTAAAVRAFQLRKGLVPDGEVGLATAAVLGVAWG